MKNWKKVVSALTFTAMLSLPFSAFANEVPVKADLDKANTKVSADYVLDSKATVHGTTIEVFTKLNGGSKLKSTLLSKLLNNNNWELVDQNGDVAQAVKSVKAKNKTDLTLYAKVENLKPSVKYCYDIRLKTKLQKQLTKANIKLQGQKDLVCATTDTPKDPKNPKDPGTPENPKDPKSPKNPNNPKEDSKKNPQSPKEDNNKQPMENPKEVKKQEQGGLFDWLLSLF